MRHWQRLPACRLYTHTKFIIIWSVFWFFVHIPLSDFLCSIIFLLSRSVVFSQFMFMFAVLNATYLEDIINNFWALLCDSFPFLGNLFHPNGINNMTRHKNDRHITKFSTLYLVSSIFDLWTSYFQVFFPSVSLNSTPFAYICISNVVDSGVCVYRMKLMRNLALLILILAHYVGTDLMAKSDVDAKFR